MLTFDRKLLGPEMNSFFRKSHLYLQEKSNPLPNTAFSLRVLATENRIVYLFFSLTHEEFSHCKKIFKNAVRI